VRLATLGLCSGNRAIPAIWGSLKQEQGAEGVAAMDWDEGSPYSWVVICKNTRFHLRKNQSVGHKILLGESDSFAAPPAIPGRFPVRCDDCGNIYSYRRSDVLRFQAEFPESFVPHPLFQQSPDAPPPRENEGYQRLYKVSGPAGLRPRRFGIFKSFLVLLRRIRP
jgi:hypothetical protein